jgi:hypothetical protein
MDDSERAAGKSGASETAVPAGMVGMIERAGCRCAEMMPRMMAMCAGTDQDGEVAEPTETAAAGSEGEMDP